MKSSELPVQLGKSRQIAIQDNSGYFRIYNITADILRAIYGSGKQNARRVSYEAILLKAR